MELAPMNNLGAFINTAKYELTSKNYPNSFNIFFSGIYNTSLTAGSKFIRTII